MSESEGSKTMPQGLTLEWLQDKIDTLTRQIEPLVAEREGIEKLLRAAGIRQPTDPPVQAEAWQRRVNTVRPIAPVAPMPEAEVEAPRLRRSRGQMSRDLQQVMVMLRRQGPGGATCADVAMVLGMPNGTAGSRLTYLKRQERVIHIPPRWYHATFRNNIETPPVALRTMTVEEVATAQRELAANAAPPLIGQSVNGAGVAGTGDKQAG